MTEPDGGCHTLAPAGYALPKAASDLITHAGTHGWATLVAWSPGAPSSGGPSLTVQVGRRLHAGEQPDARGDRWLYCLTWHSRDCAPGKLRLFGRILAQTPDAPWDHYGASIRAVRQVIAQNPGMQPAA